ncbi:MAG: YidC/Oxa1 family membrane protein insertase, partial [Bacilli bacterium]
DKSQKIMFSLMPVIMLLFFYTFPSGLVLYWLVQSLLGIIQAIIIRRGADKVVLKKREKPGFMQRLQEAMEQAAAVQESRGEEYQKLPFKEKLRIAREDAARAKKNEGKPPKGTICKSAKNGRTLRLKTIKKLENFGAIDIFNRNVILWKFNTNK